MPEISRGGATVRLGKNGPSLTVVSVDSRTKVTLSNATGSALSVPSDTRLILVSDPVTVFTSASGTAVAPGISAIDVDPTNPPAIWITRPVFDFTVGTTPVAFDAVSGTQTLTGNGPSLPAWSHTASGENRLVLVGVSWQDSLGEESISSVTYGGVAMNLLASSSLGSVYYLLNPATGAKNVVVTWSGSNPKGAVAASISFKNVRRRSQRPPHRTRLRRCRCPRRATPTCCSASSACRPELR